ncbi:hypothetical protein [Delftia sp. CH05]|uniref:hypothetical protein n=1 Tax=Delftia sp. CH05 TaxID=2692194 RepID=UPI00135E25AC|nr:hypothetical protein [Delftia sp. CH05]MXN31497.1 hypothetical protein [Delftia sp. CH05]
MSYPLINGAAINAEEAGEATVGIDLVTSGQAIARPALLPAGALPMELGAPRAALALRPAGLDLVTSGQAIARYNTALRPPGIDLVSSGQAVAMPMLEAQGAQALELGAPRVRNGLDVALVIDGLDLVRTDFAVITLDQVAPDQVVQARSARPLELGVPAAQPGAVTVQPAGAQPMALGMPGAGTRLQAQGAHPLEIGMPAAGIRLQAGAARPLGLGAPSVGVALRVDGIDLVRGGTASIALPTAQLLAASVYVLELGSPGLPSTTVRARAGFPLQLGMPAVARENTC